MSEEETGILDWYTTLVGLTALVALALHGSLWIILKTEGSYCPPELRAFARGCWWVVGIAAIMVTIRYLLRPTPRWNKSKDSALGCRLSLDSIVWFFCCTPLPKLSRQNPMLSNEHFSHPLFFLPA